MITKSQFKFLLYFVILSTTQSFAAGNFMKCNVTGYPTNGYTVQAGSDIKIPFSGSCTALISYPYGAANNLEITPISGVNANAIQVLDPNRNMYMAEIPLGGYGVDCMGGACSAITPGTVKNYTYYLVGKAPNTPGRRSVSVKYGVTAARFPAYAEWVHEFLFTYNVVAASCTLTSPNNSNLSLGTFNGEDLNDKTLTTTISLSCPSAQQANMTLSPTQPVINAAAGISGTTIDQLSIISRWSDTNQPVYLNRKKLVYLRSGTNQIGLTFKPNLLSNQYNTGEFRANYTLTIDYL